MQTFRKLIFLLSSKERKRAGLLLFMMIIMAFLDMIGVASILPFMAVLTNPSIIETNSFLNILFKYSNIFGVQNNHEFLIFLGILVFVILVFSLTFKAITTYAQLRFIGMREYTIGKRLVEKYLHQPYSWFLNRHSADLGSAILSEVSLVTGGGLSPLLELISKSLIAILIIILLFVVDVKIALIVGLLFTTIYSTIYFVTKKYLNKIGDKRLKSNKKRFTSVSEAFGGLKEVKVFGLEKDYINRFSEHTKNFVFTNAISKIISQTPRFFLEATAFGSILLLILYLMSGQGSLNIILPTLSVYVFAGYRLIPAFQQIYFSFTQLTFLGPSLDKLHKDLKNLKYVKQNLKEEAFVFNKEIRLKNVSYRYPNSSKDVLKSITLNININSTIGFAGMTGSGKTTLVDIILGLLEPQKGHLKVDEKTITIKNSRSWQRSIGYVPQQIFLSDDTITSNIAFGVDQQDIDHNLVERVSKIANLHNFVIKELPKKYQTLIGERGIRLSGGQRQRIGIARALYHNPKVLILDEATSSLDYHTEKVVMNAVNSMRKKMTIIMIAHRLPTLKKCDNIFLFENGKVVGNGNYEQLIKINKNFNLMGNS